MPTVIVAGEGLLADLLKTIVKAFQPLGLELEIDTVPCLPIPIPPDYDRYIQIITLLLLCWILTVLEPYGLRFRHWIMCYYHPVRGKERAIWLYNHILRTRSTFLKFVRRQLRRKVLGDKTVTKITLKEFLLSKFRCLGFCVGDEVQKACLVCGLVIRDTDEIKYYKCATPGCPGIYCEPCFIDIKKLCTVCLSPIEYGDLSDLSEERDSSDEENRQKRKLNNIQGKKKLDDDSDYHSSSSEPSFSYQYTKDVNQIQQSLKTSFKDLERQNIPDYASMEAFRDYPISSDSSIEDGDLIRGDIYPEKNYPRKIEVVSTVELLPILSRQSSIRHKKTLSAKGSKTIEIDVNPKKIQPIPASKQSIKKRSLTSQRKIESKHLLDATDDSTSDDLDYLYTPKELKTRLYSITLPETEQFELASTFSTLEELSSQPTEDQLESISQTFLSPSKSSSTMQSDNISVTESDLTTISKINFNVKYKVESETQPSNAQKSESTTSSEIDSMLAREIQIRKRHQVTSLHGFNASFGSERQESQKKMVNDYYKKLPKPGVEIKSVRESWLKELISKVKGGKSQEQPIEARSTELASFDYSKADSIPLISKAHSLESSSEEDF
ncbi:unnamed protein product [Brassicogethes aeneus]|uniref:Dendritic cell-specific transmembrane protein-like domain-containing protein n=1 Tax=Brassicogethes aeneus TaxID=1431903 RepID=A0A9P0AZQ4_BRAAE|nr:unnamed protein product [Brassicogethes aeneus]